MTAPAHRRCIALLGGSFDPVHAGHVALGDFFAKLLLPDELRLLPAGRPWQKDALQATPQQRVAMLRLAFAGAALPVVIDEQEIRRAGATYTIDTLRALRHEVGPQASLCLLIGADQLHKLHTWKEWQQLFDHAHLCAAARPGFNLDAPHVPQQVRQELRRRAATPEQIRNSAGGLVYLAPNLAVDISSSEIRSALQRGGQVASLLPAGVLDYIEQHHLYRN